MAANLLLIRGEAALSVGMGAIVLAVPGAVLGAALGGHPELQPRPMALGALLGAVPGVLAFVVFTQLSRIVLVIGGGVGRAHRRSRRPRAARWDGLGSEGRWSAVEFDVTSGDVVVDTGRDSKNPLAHSECTLWAHPKRARVTSALETNR